MKAIEKQQAIHLRKQGFSINEIKEQIKVSKGSISLWVRNVALSQKAKTRIEGRMTKGQIASRISKRINTSAKENAAAELALGLIAHLSLTSEYKKILCAMIYYCEGGKDVRQGVRFTNSDPILITAFMSLLRMSFNLNEAKFRACVHMHSYHDREEQLKFWSKTSNIPVQQFIKPYQKKHTGLYKKDGYQGCLSVRYGDVRIARELKAIALEFMKMGL